MGILESLRGLFEAKPKDPASEAERLAELLVSEFRLYNEAEIEAALATGRLPIQLVIDLERSYGLFLQRVDPEARSLGIFEAAIGRVLFPSSPSLTEAVMKRLGSGRQDGELTARSADETL